MLNQALLQEDIFQLIGLQNMSEDKKLEMLQKLSDIVLKEVCLRVMEELKNKDEDAKKKGEDVFKNGSDEDKMKFIMSNMDFVKILQEELVRVKEDLVRDLKSAGLIK